jgi:hypothetical protein
LSRIPVDGRAGQMILAFKSAKFWVPNYTNFDS